MPLVLKPRDALPKFTFSPPSPSPAPSPSAQPRTPPRPPADYIVERDMAMFGAYPLAGTSEAGRALLSCGKCGKVVMESAMTEHLREFTTRLEHSLQRARY